MNKAFMVGRATKDGELKVTPSGVNVGEFTLAVERGFGEKKTTDYIRCAVFGKAAEYVKSYIQKGDVLSVAGEISCNAWQSKTGEISSQMSIYVSEWKIEAKARKEQEAQQKESQPSFDDFLEVNNENIPF